MKSAPPRVDHCIGTPLALPLPPAANSTSSGLPCTSAADQGPISAGLADGLAVEPASESQVRSSVPFGKCSVRRSTVAPADESASAIESLSSDSSRKSVSGSGGLEVELAADGVPDGFFLGTVFPGQHGHRVAGLE